MLGLDVSERMLARAEDMTSDPAIAYRRADLEMLDLGTETFDFAYSSLALHYIVNLPGLLAELHRALVPGSKFVFSVEHPIVTAPIPAGWSVGPDGRKTWPIDNYQNEGSRRTNWLAEGVIKQHRTLGTLLNLLIQRRLHDRACGGMGAERGADRREPGMGRRARTPDVPAHAVQR